MTVRVKWAISPSRGGVERFPAFQVACLDPDPLLKVIGENRDKSNYLNCYAFIEALKNVYIVRSPLDFTIKFDRNNNWLSVTGVSQQVYDLMFENRSDAVGETDPVLASCFPTHLFFSDYDVQMSVWPIPILGEIKNTRVVVGSFNISKWIRPVEWSFEIIDDKEPVVVKRGDPLFAVAFTAKNNEKIQLERVVFDDSLLDAALSCVQLKKLMPKTPLNKCYEIAESFLQVWRKNRK